MSPSYFLVGSGGVKKQLGKSLGRKYNIQAMRQCEIMGKEEPRNMQIGFD